MTSDTIGTEAPGVAAAPEPSAARPPRPRHWWHAAQRRIAWLSTTRVNARAGLVADVLAGSALLAVGLSRGDNHPGMSLATILLGLLVFSFVEYCFHRWLFHGRVELLEQGHRKHHEQPLANDSLPFFAPPLAAFALAWLLAAILPMTTALLFTGGMAAGYAAYGLTHSIFHHVRFRRLFARRWAAAHHIHHCHPGSNFGVTTPLWDIVLRTRYRSARPRSAQ